jgi:hypothetical protein
MSSTDPGHTGREIGLVIPSAAPTVATMRPSPACGWSDHHWRVTARTRATSRVRCLAGRCIANAEQGLDNKNDGDSSAPEVALRYRREAAVVWSRNLLAGIPAPWPHRFIANPNRGALLEGTSLCGASRRRHTFCPPNADPVGAVAGPPRPLADPAHTLPQHRLQHVRHTYAPGRLRAARLGFPYSPCGWSGHDVDAEGAPPDRMAPQLSLSLIGLGSRPDDGQSSGRSTRGRRLGTPDGGRITYGARR